MTITFALATVGILSAVVSLINRTPDSVLSKLEQTMKIRTNNGRNSYISPKKAHRVTAKERRGLEMVQGCVTIATKRGDKTWER